MTELLYRAWDFFQAGGPVMWPLFTVSLWMWVLILMKLRWLSQTRKDQRDLRWALPYLEQKTSEPPEEKGPWSRAIGHFLQCRVRDLQADRLWWKASVERELSGFPHHVPVVLVLAAVAPLLGLLGTVLGMIKTFQVICIFGTGNAQAMAGGIKEALFTTEVGLLIAIPGFSAGLGLRRRVRASLQSFSAFSQSIERWIEGNEHATG